jgi:hypothetical protein
VATGNVVWIANPASGNVAYIDVSSLEVQTVPAGNAPTYVAAVVPLSGPADDKDRAIVLNVLSGDATLMVRDAQGVLTTVTYPATSDANSWAISPDGRWAIAWTDTTLVANANPQQGFANITILDVNPPDGTTARPPTTMATGNGPYKMVYSNDSSVVYAVTAAGIVPIDLVHGDAPSKLSAYPLASLIPWIDASTPESSTPDGGSSPDASPGNDGSAIDASVPYDGSTADALVASDGPTADSLRSNDASTMDASPPPDGGTVDVAQDSLSTDSGIADGTVEAMALFEPLADAAPLSTVNTVPDVSFSFGATWALALVRADGVPAITLLSLLDGTQSVVNLPGNPTDLTVSPDGDFAVAVIRDSSTVVEIPLPGILDDPTSMKTVRIPGETIGQAIVTQNGSRLLLFTTAAPVSRMTVLTLTPAPSYQTVELTDPIVAVFAADDEKSAVVLQNVTASNGIEGGFSFVPLDGVGLPISVPLPAPATAVALSHEGDRALVAMSDTTSATYGVVVGAMPSFMTTAYTLASPPIAVGIVEGPGRGYAAQSYTDGRITFLDLADGGARTITGFELNARVVNGGGDQ